MFKLYDEEQYIEREDDFDNTESNTYAACVYAQLSMSNSAGVAAFAPADKFEDVRK